jgi:hypothetical protein
MALFQVPAAKPMRDRSRGGKVRCWGVTLLCCTLVMHVTGLRAVADQTSADVVTNSQPRPPPQPVPPPPAPNTTLPPSLTPVPTSTLFRQGKIAPQIPFSRLTFPRSIDYSLIFGTSWGTADRGTPSNMGLPGIISGFLVLPLSPTTALQLYHVEVSSQPYGFHGVVPLLLPSGKQIGSVDLSRRGNSAVKTNLEQVIVRQSLWGSPINNLEYGLVYQRFSGGIPGTPDASLQWTPQAGVLTAYSESQYVGQGLEYYHYVPKARVFSLVSLGWYHPIFGRTQVNVDPNKWEPTTNDFFQWEAKHNIFLVDFFSIRRLYTAFMPFTQTNINNLYGFWIRVPHRTVVQFTVINNITTQQKHTGLAALVCVNPPTCSTLGSWLGAAHSTTFQLGIGIGEPTFATF